MKLVITKIESTHDITKKMLNEEITDIISNNTSMTFLNNNEYIMRTSSIKKITIETLNSKYTLERIGE